MITYATFRHGMPLMVDYTPGADVSAGDVIVLGNQIRIAHRDIASGNLGALAAGGGVYDLPKGTTSGTGSNDGQLLYWDATAHTLVETSNSGANLQFGYAVGATVDADTIQRAIHWPA